MKTAILALCLLGAVFAAPIENYIDPDCIEEDQTFEEPIADIDAEFALGVPDRYIDFSLDGNNNNANDEECEDDVVSEAPVFAPEPVSEECEEELEPTTAETEAPPATDAENCEDPIEYTEAPPVPTTEEAAEDCLETEATEEPVVVTEENGDLCEDGEEAAEIPEQMPALNIRIEPADFHQDQLINNFGEEQEFEPIEECEE